MKRRVIPALALALALCSSLTALAQPAATPSPAGAPAPQPAAADAAPDSAPAVAPPAVASPAPPPASEPAAPVVAPRDLIEERPLQILIETGLGNPAGVFGASVGYHLAKGATVELHGGLSYTGYQVGVLARGRWSNALRSHSFTLGVGPSVGLRGEPLGLYMPSAPGIEVDPDTIYYIAWLNAELGYEHRWPWGGVLHTGVGLALRIAENQTQLCEGVDFSNLDYDAGGCVPRHAPSSPELASRWGIPFISFGYGHAF